jgi:peptide chain release factor 1
LSVSRRTSTGSTASGGGFEWVEDPASSQRDTDRCREYLVLGDPARAESAFANEAGGHRFQRVPPSEKRGRVHTSTITIAVLAGGGHSRRGRPDAVPLQNKEPRNLAATQEQLKLERYKGGKGGQHQNKHANNVRLTHTPTGTTVQVEGRYFHKNRDKAYKLMEDKLAAAQAARAQAAEAAVVADQVGSGMRGDKVMTAALQRDTVVHHVTGKTTTAKRYLRGYVDDLH